MHFIKIHRSYRNVIAICDSDIIGKRFEEGKRQLDVRENFFNGEETTSEEILKRIKRQMVEDSTFNIVGQESVKLAVQAGLISKEHIAKIQGTPFALTLI